MLGVALAITWHWFYSVNLHIKPGELLAVVGLVGAGKSSLVQAILGEMVKLNGDVAINVRKLQTNMLSVILHTDRLW